MPDAASNSVSPSTRTCPASGRNRPAIMLSTLVLPTPDGPNSTVSPSAASKRQATSLSPSRRVTSTSKDMQPPARPPREQLGSDQGGERQRDRDRRQPPHQCVAAGRLERGVDGARQRPRLAGHVGDEGDRRAELAQPAREAEHGAREDAGQAQRQREGGKAAPAPRAARPR